MKRLGLWLSLAACAVPGLSQTKAPASTLPAPPHISPTTGVKDFYAALDDIQCRAKLAEWKKWADSNVPIHDAVLAENQNLRSELASAHADFNFGIGAGIGSVGALAMLIWFIRKRLVPKTARSRQAAVLIPAALWMSFCFIGIANDADLMVHPINAAVTALMWSSPAILFAGILLWRLSPPRAA